MVSGGYYYSSFLLLLDLYFYIIITEKRINLLMIVQNKTLSNPYKLKFHKLYHLPQQIL